MAESKNRRFSIQVSSDNRSDIAVYDYMMDSECGLRVNVLEACKNYYLPLALIESGADKERVLKAAISSVNQLYQQIQSIVELAQYAGIEPTPLMLAKAGITGYLTPAASPGSSVPLVSSATDAPSLAPQLIKEGDNDDWGEIPPLTERELALIKEADDDFRS